MKWGIVGASTIASEWMIDAIRGQGGSVDVLSSGSGEYAHKFAEKHGIPSVVNDPNRFSSFELDAVYVSSINHLHLDHVAICASMGLHILCEKPLTLDLVEAQSMLEICSTNNVLLATNHHLRYAGTHKRIRELIAEGVIGEILSARVFHAVSLPPHLQGWRINQPDQGGGVVVDIAVHNADVLSIVMGGYPESIQSMTAEKSLGQGVEDESMSIWRYAGDRLVYTHESFVTPFAGHGIEFHGTEGSLVGRGVMSQQPIGQVMLNNSKGQQEIAVIHRNLYEGVIANFCEAVAKNQAPWCDGVAGYNSLATALAVIESARTGQSQSPSLWEA
ncbi:Gfo/Idh/MocA family oxidoreductase [Litoricolaceae bacterium]|jgi:1,5-anhydro-D-fructose reductase (1,5-anhydro-D-mannitol-forming)|nr:Gfo/Idh/MocA family oxidoreductase [Litorivicinaceae bacterium]